MQLVSLVAHLVCFNFQIAFGLEGENTASNNLSREYLAAVKCTGALSIQFVFHY